MRLQKKLVEKYPRSIFYQIDLGGQCCNFGHLLRSDGKPAESLTWFAQGIELLKPLHDKYPDNTTVAVYLGNTYENRAIAYYALKKYQEAVEDWNWAVKLAPAPMQAGRQANRAMALVRCNKASEAVAECHELRQLSHWKSHHWYCFACIYALASQQMPEKQVAYEAEAIKLLQQAVKAGFSDMEQLMKNQDLQPLRSREDFKQIIQSLNKQPSTVKD